jgi:hypothetical protein
MILSTLVVSNTSSRKEDNADSPSDLETREPEASAAVKDTVSAESLATELDPATIDLIEQLTGIKITRGLEERQDVATPTDDVCLIKPRESPLPT